MPINLILERLRDEGSGEIVAGKATPRSSY